MTNVIREIRNRVNAEARMQKQFDAAKEKALRSIEEYIASLFADGQETIDFRFDAFSFWMKAVDGGAEDLWGFIKEQNLYTDGWNRAVWSLTKDQAVTIARHVEEWNADWEYAISHSMDYYNAYHISFSSATGTEHVISVPTGGHHKSDSWQWN